MTRKDKIDEAALMYRNALYDRREDVYCIDLLDIGDAFKAGVKWADSHPKKTPIKSWISVKDDLPCNHKELITPDVFGWTYTQRVLVRLNDGIISMHNMKKQGDGDFEWNLIPLYKVTHWMPIPELQKTK